MWAESKPDANFRELSTREVRRFTLQHHLALACSVTPILSIFRPTLSVFITFGLLDTGTAGGVRHVVPHK